MIGSEYKWLLRSTRVAGRVRVRLLGSSLFTLLIVICCLVGTALAPVKSYPATCAALQKCDQALANNPATDWPRTLNLVWFVLPHLIPRAD